MKKRVSLKDIAEKVGVSTSLVSYVLNNRLENRINKETAKKIRKVAQEMNYQPNQIAKSLKSNKTQTIGLIVADIANPFSSTMARIIEDEAKQNNYTVIFGSADENAKKSQSLINVLLSRQVDGFIIAPPAGLEKQLLSLKQQDVPFVLIDRYFQDMDVNYIAIDNFQTSYNAVSHLIENGFKRIGFINYKTKLIHLKERTRGYKEALAQGTLSFSKQNIKEINESNLKQEISTAIDQLMKQEKPIDALFFSSSNIAIEGLAYLSRLGTIIPEELAVVCFDETNAYNLFQYPLTYIKQPLKEIGQTAVQLLLESMKDRSVSKRIVLDTDMIVRSSSQRKDKTSKIN